MKIKIKDLQANPFRDIENYPISSGKVAALKESINQTGFWDNILARPVKGFKIVEDELNLNDMVDEDIDQIRDLLSSNLIWTGDENNEPEYLAQLAYGHHRMEALRGIDPEMIIDIPIKNIDDTMMLRIMANENKTEYKTSPQILVETVKAVRNYLNAELKKAKPDRGLIDLLDLGNRSALENAKSKGVGQTTIKNFLGSTWLQWEIQAALSQIDSVEAEEVSKEALNKLSTNSHGESFVRAIRKAKINGIEFTEAEQVNLANQINLNDVNSKSIVSVIDHIVSEKKYGERETKERIKKDKVKQLDQYIEEISIKAIEMRKDIGVLSSLKDEFKTVDRGNLLHRAVCLEDLRNLAKAINQFEEFLNEEIR